MACPTCEWSYGVMPQTYILTSSPAAVNSSARRDIVLYRRTLLALGLHAGLCLPEPPGFQLRDPRLQLLDARLQVLDHVPFGVRQAQHRVVPGVCEGHHVAGNADHGGVWRHVGDDDGTGADLGVLADRHVADDL